MEVNDADEGMIGGAMGDNKMKSDKLIPVQFISNIGLKVPPTQLTVPRDADSDMLNSILTEMMNLKEKERLNKSVPEKHSRVFDFVINGILLRTTLDEAVLSQSLSVESVLQIECIERQDAPKPGICIQDKDWIACIRCSENIIVTGCYDNTVSLWNTKSGTSLAHLTKLHDKSVKTVAFLPKSLSGNLVEFVSAGLDQTVVHTAFDRKSGVAKTLCHYRGHERSIECASFSGDSGTLATGSFDGHLKIWKTFDGQTNEEDPEEESRAKRKHKTENDEISRGVPLVTLAGHRESVSGVQWHGKECVTCSFDCTLAVWDLTLAGMQSQLHSNRPFTSVSVCPANGLLITSSVDKCLRMWDTRVKDGSMVRRVFSGHSGWVQDVCWSPDQDHLFVSAGYDNLLKMWDIRSPDACLYDMAGHADKLMSCDWSLPGMIASAGCDNTFRTYYL